MAKHSVLDAGAVILLLLAAVASFLAIHEYYGFLDFGLIGSLDDVNKDTITPFFIAPHTFDEFATEIHPTACAEMFEWLGTLLAVTCWLYSIKRASASHPALSLNAFLCAGILSGIEVAKHPAERVNLELPIESFDVWRITALQSAYRASIHLFLFTLAVAAIYLLWLIQNPASKNR